MSTITYHADTKTLDDGRTIVHVYPDPDTVHATEVLDVPAELLALDKIRELLPHTMGRAFTVVRQESPYSNETISAFLADEYAVVERSGEDFGCFVIHLPACADAERVALGLFGFTVEGRVVS